MNQSQILRHFFSFLSVFVSHIQLTTYNKHSTNRRCHRLQLDKNRYFHCIYINLGFTNKKNSNSFLWVPPYTIKTVVLIQPRT